MAQLKTTYMFNSTVPIAIVCAIISCVLFTSCDLTYEGKLDEFSDEVMAEVLLSDLTEWSLVTIDRYSDKSSPHHISDFLLPSGFDRINDGLPNEVIYMPASEASPSHLWLIWGGGFGHWGLKIGGADLELESNSENHYIPWGKGTFFWHEIQ